MLQSCGRSTLRQDASLNEGASALLGSPRKNLQRESACSTRRPLGAFIATFVGIKHFSLLITWGLCEVHLVPASLLGKGVQQLNLTEHTVRDYLMRILDKLGISSRVELVFLCVQRDGGERHHRELQNILHVRVNDLVDTNNSFRGFSGEARVGGSEPHITQSRVFSTNWELHPAGGSRSLSFSGDPTYRTSWQLCLSLDRPWQDLVDSSPVETKLSR